MNESQYYNTGLFYTVNKAIVSDEEFTDRGFAKLWNDAPSFSKLVQRAACIQNLPGERCGVNEESLAMYSARASRSSVAS